MSIDSDKIISLSNWVTCTERTLGKYSQFSVIDVETNDDALSSVRPYLVSMLRNARFDPALIRTLMKDLGWEADAVMKFLINPLLPERERIRRGEFGEILFGNLLEQFHEYRIPVIKLRYKMTSDQTLPATDILAFLLTPDGQIQEVCYTECKLRTLLDKRAAWQAAEQLQADYQSEMPEILTFVLKQLHSTSSPLLVPFSNYMASRQNTTEKDNFRLGLFFDKSKWSDDVLDALEENFAKLPRLQVHVVLLNSLRQITDDLFQEIGVVEILDDESEFTI